MRPHRRDFSQKLKNLYAYATAVMEAWDGPAAICAAHGDWAIAGMDRNGLRPIRYTLTSEYLIAGSETGMVVMPENQIVEKEQKMNWKPIPFKPSVDPNINTQMSV